MQRVRFNANHDGIIANQFAASELVESMVVFDPSGRISASDALHSPYLSSYHDPTDEPVASKTFDWAVDEAYCSDDAWKQKLYVFLHN